MPLHREKNVSAPFTVSSTEDAIHVAESTLGPHSLCGLVLDAKMALPVSGDVPPDGVVAWHAILLDALGDQHDRLVLASRRATGPSFVLEDELASWRAMHERHRGRNLALADWLVFVRDDVVLSLAEIAGPEAAWS
jgi:hypothetical protein